jgi:hypothetical protein
MTRKEIAVRTRFTIPAHLATLLLLAHGSLAQIEAPGEAQDIAQEAAFDPFQEDDAARQDDQATDIRFTFGGGYTHRFETDIDSGGEFSLDTYSFGLDVSHDFSRDASLTFRADYGVASYEFGGSTGLGGLDPWHDIHTLSFGAALSVDLNDRFNVFAGPVFQFSRESGADWTDGFIGGGIGGVTYRVHDHLFLGGGLGVVSQIEDDVRLFPIIIVEWQISRQWRISSRGASGGRTSVEFTGIEAIYSPTDEWEFALGGGSSFSRFRLDDDLPASDGVGEDESTPVWLRASWKPNETFSLDAIGGVSFGGELKLEDDDGDNIATSDYDAAPFVGVFGSVRF